MNAVRGRGLREESHLFDRVIALLGVKPVPTKHGEVLVSDLLVVQPDWNTGQPMKLGELLSFIGERRILKWQEEVTDLLDAGAVTIAGLKRALPHNRNLGEFLSQRNAAKTAASAVR